jgi:hypothetical protein
MSYLRADRQGAAYWAQMDLRHDLEYIWQLQEKEQVDQGYIYIKLVLPDGTQEVCDAYLKGRSPPITHEYLFPEEGT